MPFETPMIDADGAAVAAWGGYFWLFGTTTNSMIGSASVTRLLLSTNTQTIVKLDLGVIIVGAGTSSICPPL